MPWGAPLIRILLAAVAAIVVGAPAMAAPLETYGRLPTISDVKLSPDGSKVAYIVNVPGHEGVVGISLETSK